MEKSSRLQWRLRPYSSSRWRNTPIGWLVCVLISPVGGGFCPLRGWFAGDTVLLCSDGLTNMVDDTDIKRIVLGQRDIVEKTQRLIDAANENGGKDNITVVLIEPFSDETR